jgi:hypothetical protein
VSLSTPRTHTRPTNIHLKVISALRCDLAVAYSGSQNNGSCQNSCFCNADSGATHAYCVDDCGSLSSCGTDSDCARGEFCDASIGCFCDSGLSCASSYSPPGSTSPTRRDVFGSVIRSRVARVQERAVNKDGPNWKAYEEAVGGGSKQ